MQRECASTLITAFLADKPVISGEARSLTPINTVWLPSGPAWLQNNCVQVMPTALAFRAGKGMLDHAWPFQFSFHDRKLLHFSELSQCHNRK